MFGHSVSTMQDEFRLALTSARYALECGIGDSEIREVYENNIRMAAALYEAIHTWPQ